MPFLGRRKRSAFRAPRNVRRRTMGRTMRRTWRTRLRRGRTGGFSTNTQTPYGGARFRSRRLPYRRFINKMFRSTDFQPHWRSIRDFASVLTTPATVVDASLITIDAYPDNFYLAAGGAQPIDAGVGVPTFGRQIFLRGGLCRLTIALADQSPGLVGRDTVRARVFGVWTKANPDFSLIPGGPVTASWDPSVVNDFTQVGKIVLRREFLLKQDGEAFDVIFRMRPQKIDRQILLDRGNRLTWVILVNQVTNTEVVPAGEAVQITVGNNFSFTADEV